MYSIIFLCLHKYQFFYPILAASLELRERPENSELLLYIFVLVFLVTYIGFFLVF